VNKELLLKHGLIDLCTYWSRKKPGK